MRFMPARVRPPEARNARGAGGARAGAFVLLLARVPREGARSAVSRAQRHGRP